MTGSSPARQADHSANLTLAKLLDSLDELRPVEGTSELNVVDLKQGEVLFRQGDKPDAMYVVLAGMLGVKVRHEDGSESEIDRLAPGAIAGEMALLSGQRRSATVYALNDASLIKLDRAAYGGLVEGKAEAEAVVAAGYDVRWQRVQLARILKDYLGDVGPGMLQGMQRELEWLHLSNGDILCRQGEAADAMYIVVNGRLRMSVEPAGQEPRVVGEVTPGDSVGEFALLTGEPRSATVYAVRETNVVKLTRRTFERLERDYPPFMRHLTRLIVQRQQRIMAGAKKQAPATLSVALLPAHPGVDVVTFAHDLGKALEPYGKTLVLDQARFDDRFGQRGALAAQPGDALHTAVDAWLDDVETANAYMVYVAGAEVSPWTDRCIGRADRVLIVADPAQDPAPGPVERRLDRMQVPVRTELVLYHPAGTARPSGTARWLDARRIEAHHHVRQGSEQHIARLARRLAGHAVALVFGGGAARAYAQMGVYKAFLDLGIPVDYVAGTSMGAIMAGGVATEYPYEEIEARADWAGKAGIMDWTLPLAAMTKSANVTRLCQHNFGDFQIEDLWLPFFCVSTSVSNAEPVIHRRGPMWRAIRASMSIPGVFLPVVEDGNVLVDGAVMNNFPVDLMASYSESDRVIGVVISPYKQHKRKYDYDTSLSGWKVLLSRIFPFGRRLRAPSMLNTLMRASELNGVRLSRLQEQQADLLIVPEVSDFKLTDYTKWKAISEVGYRAALEPLRAWKEAQGVI